MRRFIKYCDAGDMLGERSTGTFDAVHTVTVQRAESSLAFRNEALLVEEEPHFKHITRNEHFAERTFFQIFKCKRVFI